MASELTCLSVFRTLEGLEIEPFDLGIWEVVCLQIGGDQQAFAPIGINIDSEGAATVYFSNAA